MKYYFRWPICRKPSIKDKLVFAFTDPQGRHYYKFRDETEIPADRIAPIHKLMVEAARGLDTKELCFLLDIADTHIHKGLNNPANAAKVGGIIHEIRLREKQISKPELYYGMLAACYVREDEDPKVFNTQCQLEKIETFKKAADKLDSFFFALPEYKELCKRLNILTNDWQMVIESSELAQLRNQKAAEILK